MIKLNDVSKILIAYSVLLIRIHLAVKFHKNPIVRFCVMLSDSNCTTQIPYPFIKEDYISFNLYSQNNFESFHSGLAQCTAIGIFKPISQVQFLAGASYFSEGYFLLFSTCKCFLAKAFVVKKCHRRKFRKFHLKIHFFGFLKYMI